MARRSKYGLLVQPYLEQIKTWRQEGLTIKKIAENLEMLEVTLSYYKTRHPELAEALELPEVAENLSPLEQREKDRKAYLNRQKSYNSVRSFIKVRSSSEERIEFFRVSLEKAEL
jgi:DNA-binding transcriptional MerR regulator